MRVRWRLILRPISRKPVRMKLTRERYPNPEREKDFSAPFGSCVVRVASEGMWLFLGLCQFRQDTEVFERSRVAGDLVRRWRFLSATGA